MSASAVSPGVEASELTDRRVLVVEDDPTVREVVVTYLTAAGLLVDAVSDGLAALRSLETVRPDLVILDRVLPGVDGVEVCRRIRRSSSVPVLLLTALGSEEERIQGLEAGADDYVVKPFSPRELVLRVRMVLRRTLVPFAPESAFDIGEFRLDPNTRTVLKRGEPLHLSTREYDLLAYLLKHPRQAFTRQQLLKAVWEWDFGDASTVTVHVRRVREKIEDDPTQPKFLATVWGTGYRLSV